jgi:hypothetical protein
MSINIKADLWRGNKGIFDLSSPYPAGGRDLKIDDAPYGVEITIRFSDEQLHALANELTEWGYGDK